MIRNEKSLSVTVVRLSLREFRLYFSCFVAGEEVRARRPLGARGVSGTASTYLNVNKELNLLPSLYVGPKYIRT